MVKKIDALTGHSYIAKSQAKYLNLKESIDKTACIALADFSENYSVPVQDAVQGWYFSKQQCTLHPIVIYYRDSLGKLQVMNLAFVSDDLNHDTCFVYDLQKLLCLHIKTHLPDVKLVHYFSDGCAGQYKNYKNFLNLIFHEDDFEIRVN